MAIMHVLQSLRLLKPLHAQKHGLHLGQFSTGSDQSLCTREHANGAGRIPASIWAMVNCIIAMIGLGRQQLWSLGAEWGVSTGFYMELFI
jgi:hypothetical protein